MSEERPKEKMSQEEHSVLTDLTATVRVLTTGLGELKTIVGNLATNMDQRITALSDRGRFSRGDWFALISALAVIGTCGASYVSLSTDNKLSPIVTQNTVSFNERHQNANDIRELRGEFQREQERTRAEEQKAAVERGILRERQGEMFHKLYGHYPRD